MNKMFFIITLVTSLAQAQFKIESVIPQKGYILSKDLFKKKCENIWTKQISIFKQNNPHIKDPNILSIGKEIQVQNCMAQLKKEESKPVAPIATEKKAEPKKEKLGIFVSLGAQFNSIDKKDSDEGKHGSGFRLDIGKRIDKNKQEIKISLGAIQNKTKTDSDVEMNRTLLSLNAGYLYKLNSIVKIGPNAEILYNSISASFKNPPNRETINPYLGINGEIKMYKDLFLDLKVQKSINERMDFVNSVSLGLDF